MKEKINRLILLVCLTFACVIGFAACNLVTSVDFKLQFIVDGEIYATIDTAGEETIRLPDDPEKDGYVFDGWYWDENTWERPFTVDSLLNEKLTSDMSVYAKWIDEEAVVQEFTVTFNSMGGSEVESKTVKDGELLTEPAEPKYDGYIFNGWYKDEACTQSWVFESDKVTASITLYAGWLGETATTFTVTYIDGAETLYTKKVVENGKAENINISKEGYTFKGWLLDGTAFDFATPITENITLTADWEIKTYTITFIVDGEQVEQFEVDYLGSVPEIPEVPSKTGYIGTWNITDFSNITKELTVTAVYTAKTYTAALDYAGANRGNSLQSITLTYGQPIGTLPTPGKTDCTFSGWFYEGTQITASTIWQNDVSTEIKFTAKWIVADNGHAIVSSDHFTFTDETTLTQDGTLRNVVDTYDLRGKFTVSAGASWRAFTSPDCSQPTEITTRIASVNPGWNNVYILVENNTTYEQSVYNLRIYRNRILQVPVYYNETVQYNSINFEENVAAGETGNAVFPAFTVENYSCDGKYYSDVHYSTEWTDDVLVTESTAIYIQAYCHDVTVSGNTVKGMNKQPGNVHLVIPNTVDGMAMTAIDGKAFKNTGNIVSITIPDCITSVGQDAFMGTAFYNNADNWHNNVLYCDGILLKAEGDISGSYSIIQGTRLLADAAFYECNSLIGVVVPDSVTIIGDDAFFGCSSMEAVSIADIAAWCKIGFGNYAANPLYYANNLFVNNELVTELIIPGTVTKIERYAFYNCSSLKSVIIPNSVYSIGLNAFRDCSSLIDITISDTVTNIEDYAFRDCSSLTSITIPSGVESINYCVFDGCSSLKSISIPKGVTIIEDYAFRDCSSLESAIIPNSVHTMGLAAFGGCSSLKSITVPFVGAFRYGTSNNHFGYIFGAESHNENSDYVPESLKTVVITGGGSIALSAFENCTSLESVTIPDGATSIGTYAFENCHSLKSVTLPDRLQSIGGDAFRYCRSLTSIIIPESVTNIGLYAFYGCYKLVEVYNLSSLNIQEGSTENGYVAYYALDVYKDNNTQNNLYTTNDGYIFYEDGEVVYLISYIGTQTQITLPDKFNGKNYLIYLYAFSGCDWLIDVTISDGVKIIEEYAFSGCSSLESITIPDSVTAIGSYAFNYCSSLKSITLPDGEINIGSHAFYGCESLDAVYIADIAAWCEIGFGDYTANPLYYAGALYVGTELVVDLVIPEGVTSIGDYAFYNCTWLTSVTIPDSVTSIGKEVFYNCKGLISITLPFVGETIDGTVNTHFGYIFGASKYSDNKNYVPRSLKTVIVNGGERIVGHAFYGCSGLTSITIPDSVTSIGSYAFYNCSGLTSITLGESVTSIGDYAFYNCSSLTSITIPDSVSSIGSSAFYGCSGLTSITIPDSVTSIGSYAFYNCSGLTSITLGESVTSIGDFAFNSCDNLTNVEIPDSVTSIGSSAFYGCSSLTSITIPDSVTSIGSYAFRDCSGLTSITLGESVTSIGSSAFYGCSGLTSITIPDSVTSIGSYAFYNCSGLTSITIPDSVTGIGQYAFSGCSNLIQTENGIWYVDKWVIGRERSYSSVILRNNTVGIADNAFSGYSTLTSITIPDSVTSIGNNAFYNCSGLTSITLGKSVTSIGYYAFCNCSGLTSITIPDSVTSIGERAFFGCSNLIQTENGISYVDKWIIDCEESYSSVILRNNTVGIADYAFRYCSSLTSITIPDSVSSIGSCAFLGCSSLTSIAIPDNVTSIGISAFNGCSSLTSITIPDSVTSIGDYAFYNCSSLTSIRYTGTMEQWNAITKGNSWNNNTGNYIIVCNDGSINKN